MIKKLQYSSQELRFSLLTQVQNNSLPHMTNCITSSQNYYEKNESQTPAMYLKKDFEE